MFEHARRVKVQADLLQLKFDRMRAGLLLAADVREAVEIASAELERIVETLPSRAAEIAAAIARDGEAGARTALREIARDTRERLAQAMTALAKKREAVENK